MLEYNKKYAILAFNCTLKNSKRTQESGKGIETLIQNKIKTHKTLKRAFVNIKG